MNKEKKLERTKINNYEVLCIIKENTHGQGQKNDFVEKIRKFVQPESFVAKSEVKKLAYPIEEIKTAEYLLLNFKVERGKVAEIEEILKSPLVIRHMTINLDTEKRIKIKNSAKMQKNRRVRKPEFKTEKSPLEKSDRKVSQESRSQLGVNN